jgi:hypothetical protein
MSKRLSRYWLAGVLTAVAIGTSIASPSAQATAQPVSIQAALSNDVGTLSDKFVGLAKAMTGKYDWRPGPGVRSVGEVFNLIVGENKMLAGLLSGAPSQGGEHLGQSIAYARSNSVVPPWSK